MIHELKILPEYFEEVLAGKKVSEVRKNDRDFKVGDTIILKEWDGNDYTGQEIKGTITYILSDFEGLKEGYVLLDIIYEWPSEYDTDNVTVIDYKELYDTLYYYIHRTNYQVGLLSNIEKLVNTQY